jgi:hypothetical protein
MMKISVGINRTFPSDEPTLRFGRNTFSPSSKVIASYRSDLTFL